MFSFISLNWRGRPLVSYRTIVELISNTTTSKGLKIRAEEDLTTLDRHQGQRRRDWPTLPSRRTSSTATGTTRLRNQSIGEPLAATSSWIRLFGYTPLSVQPDHPVCCA